MTSIWLIIEHESGGDRNIYRINENHLSDRVKETLRSGDVDLTHFNLQLGKPFPDLDELTSNCDIRTELAHRRRLKKNSDYLQSLSLDPLCPVIIKKLVDIYQPREDDLGCF